jgi:hypothetical protein
LISPSRDVLRRHHRRDAELKIVILTAAPDTEDETKLELAFLPGARLCTLTVT